MAFRCVDDVFLRLREEAFAPDHQEIFPDGDFGVVYPFAQFALELLLM